MSIQKPHYHFMGISGIGMSGIAKVMIQHGYHVSGCDNHIDEKHVYELRKLGCQIAPYHQHELCKDPSITTVVYTSEIKLTHPELVDAQSRNIPIILRAAMLAELMKNKTSISVAGSHGKTTTSSLMGHVLLQAQFDPTIVVGGHMHELASNAYAGKSSWMVVESDESDRSFLLFPKKFTIVTNIDLEHLETYKDFDDIKQSFIKYINTIPTDGLNVICLDDQGIQSVLPQITTPYITYGTHYNADWQIKNIQINADHSIFDIYHPKTNTEYKNIVIALPGMHNILNATGVFALSMHLGINAEIIKTAFKNFLGIDRRFTLKGISKIHGALVFDDYGHHPAELDCTFKVARARAAKKLFVVFQPHRFTRTKYLWDDFVKVFANTPIDHIIITDIFEKNEPAMPGVTSPELVQAILKANPQTQITYIPLDKDGTAILNFLNNHLEQNDLLLFQGAGKVNKLATNLL